MTPEQLQTLRTEIDTDPNAVGYAGMSDEQVANALNATGVEIDRDSLTGGDLASSVDGNELIGLTAAQRAYVQSLFACQSIMVTANFRNILANLFPAGSETRQNLVALFKRDGSRAQQLGLPGVTPSAVADARRL